MDWTKKATYGEVKTPENNTRIQLSIQVDGNDASAKEKPDLLADYLSAEVEGSVNGIAKMDFKFSTLLIDELPIWRAMSSKVKPANSPRTQRPGRQDCYY